MPSKKNTRKRLEYKHKRKQTSFMKERSMKKQIIEEKVEEVQPNTEQTHQPESNSKKVESVPQKEDSVSAGRKPLPSRYIYMVIIFMDKVL